MSQENTDKETTGAKHQENHIPPLSSRGGAGGGAVLLHSCCAPCSSAILEWMLANDVTPIIYYYNPNIYPEDEYLIRKREITRYAEQLGVEIIDDDEAPLPSENYYTAWEKQHKQWLECIKGLESEPERGSRCLECFRLRLYHAARKAHDLGIEMFTTTLASSRWKNLEQINEAGAWAAAQFNDVTFWDKNWRKGGLQDRRNQLLRENNFYNQLYCGCEFSIRKATEETLP